MTHEGRRDVVAVVALAALAILFLWRLALTNLVLARGDVLLYFYPLWDYRAEALRAGYIPLWNPYLFMGAPFLANSQAGVLYPLNWPLAWLSSHVAYKIAILTHLVLAGASTFLFARLVLGTSRLAAWLAALAFAVGGYLTAQVEHINQLQGLAWLPLAFTMVGGRARALRRIAALAVILALQLLAGHTQSWFITLVGLALFVAGLVPVGDRGAASGERRRWQAWIGRAAPLAGVVVAALGALLLAAAQVIPTLELSRLSQRGGGLPFHEAISFSLHPFLLGRALLPGFGETIFSEYVGYLGVSGLLLAWVGAWTRRRDARIVALAGLGVVGLLFALGGYNPLYWLLVQAAPGFNLFRVPARWLVLTAFAGALLAGVGLDVLRQSATPRRVIAITLLVLGVLAFTSLLLEPPGLQTVAGWLVTAALSSVLLASRAPSLRITGMTALVIVELFAASRALPYNHLTAPEAVTSLRPAVSQLIAGARSGPLPAARFLSMSQIPFDPGDLAEIRSIYDQELPPDAVYDYVIASKTKEVLAPNLPLSYHVMATDGFDGGLLPLRRYVELSRLLLPADRIAPDGRLRENLRAIPENRILDLLNIGTLITDKTGDIWVDDAYYDLQHAVTLSNTNPMLVLDGFPPFEATALGVLAGRVDLAGAADGSALQLDVQFDDGRQATFAVTPGGDVTRVRWESGATYVRAIRAEIMDRSEPVVLRSLALIDERTGAFQTLTVSQEGKWRLVHSGDVKVYTNSQALARVYVVHRGSVIPDDVAAREALRSPDFQPDEMVILSEGQPLEDGGRRTEDRVEVLSYAPERVVLEVELESAGLLVLSDTEYPGWRALVDGVETPILRANLLFRAVALLEGQHQVEFIYEPASWRVGLAVSVVSLGLLLLTIAIGVRKRT